MISFYFLVSASKMTLVGNNFTSQVINFTDIVANGTGCLPGWTLISPGGMCLLFVNKNASFGDAEYHCGALGGTLAYAVSNNLVTWTQITALVVGVADVWTGIQRLRNSFNYWTPVSNDAPATLTDLEWLTDSANGLNCVSIRRSNQTLSARNCSDMLPFVCQQPAPSIHFSFLINISAISETIY